MSSISYFIVATIMLLSSVKAATTCLPNVFGDGIHVTDCELARQGFMQQLQTLNAPHNDFTFRLYESFLSDGVPRFHSAESCTIGLDIENVAHQEVTGNVKNIRDNITQLMNDCAAHTSGGFISADGLVYVIANTQILHGVGNCFKDQSVRHTRKRAQLNLVECILVYGSGLTHSSNPGTDTVLPRALPYSDHIAVQPSGVIPPQALLKNGRKVRRADGPSRSSDDRAPGRPPGSPSDGFRGQGIQRGDSPPPSPVQQPSDRGLVTPSMDSAPPSRAGSPFSTAEDRNVPHNRGTVCASGELSPGCARALPFSPAAGHRSEAALSEHNPSGVPRTSENGGRPRQLYHLSRLIRSADVELQPQQPDPHVGDQAPVHNHPMDPSGAFSRNMGISMPIRPIPVRGGFQHQQGPFQPYVQNHNQLRTYNFQQDAHGVGQQQLQQLQLLFQAQNAPTAAYGRQLPGVVYPLQALRQAAHQHHQQLQRLSHGLNAPNAAYGGQLRGVVYLPPGHPHHSGSSWHRAPDPAQDSEESSAEN